MRARSQPVYPTLTDEVDLRVSPSAARRRGSSLRGTALSGTSVSTSAHDPRLSGAADRPKEAWGGRGKAASGPKRRLPPGRVGLGFVTRRCHIGVTHHPKGIMRRTATGRWMRGMARKKQFPKASARAGVRACFTALRGSHDAATRSYAEVDEERRRQRSARPRHAGNKTDEWPGHLRPQRRTGVKKT